MKRKIAFFDIDGTLTSELDGSIPDSTVSAIRKARANQHIMLINTGRCFQNVEERFRSIGFDGYVCGCGTNIYVESKELLHHSLSVETVAEILQAARQTDVDILFESKTEVVFDLTRPLKHPNAIRQFNSFRQKQYDMSHHPDSSDFTCDKFVIWYEHPKQLEKFRKTSDIAFDCIDRGGTFREFVPHGYSKATGIRHVLNHYHCSIEDCYVFGDSNNDLPMLTYAPNSIVMGNTEEPNLIEIASFVTKKASEGGIEHALRHFHFI